MSYISLFTGKVWALLFTDNQNMLNEGDDISCNSEIKVICSIMIFLDRSTHKKLRLHNGYSGHFFRWSWAKLWYASQNEGLFDSLLEYPSNFYEDAPPIRINPCRFLYCFWLSFEFVTADSTVLISVTFCICEIITISTYSKRVSLRITTNNVMISPVRCD